MLAQQQEKRLADVVPVPYFNKLPLEIRRMIWQFTLPGPRTLCASTEKGESYMIYNWDEKSPPREYSEEEDKEEEEEEEEEEEFHAHHELPTNVEPDTQNNRMEFEDAESISTSNSETRSSRAGTNLQTCEAERNSELIVDTESNEDSIDSNESDSDSDDYDEPYFSDDSSDWEDRTQGGEKVLYFPRRHQPPNPSALGVCRESREVALQRFRLCFGTTNVYVDLDTDIIFFSPYPWDITEFGDLHRGRYRSEVVDDVEKIQCLGFKMTNGWGMPRCFLAPHSLRSEFRVFTNLKEVMLSHNLLDGGSHDVPGRIVLEEFDDSCIIFDPSNEDENLILADVCHEDVYEGAEHLMELFSTRDEFFPAVTPQMKLVAVKRIPNLESVTLVDQEAHMLEL
ncbi:uncharacterized protein PAC_05291 [Phialocephala subalpina]|uniref:2EXR domain-containing protein n=1 Tax=Phialocephala subalpina TaxID=576137 RepID=A0A1L7WRK7_9HELO|nr:uncharacterized protein PAC_05291 [Phialocephala subalpina]